MDILVDNKDLKEVYGIDVLDYTGAFGIAAERVNEITWADKSGVDKNLANIRYEEREFVIKCLVNASNEGEAWLRVKALTDYMFSKGCFVLSLRDTTKGIRECFICERSKVIVGNINVRQQNSLYLFNLGLKDINPNAVTYKTEVIAGEASILYEKGQTAVIYWGDGSIDQVSNSGTYTKTDYSEDGIIDVIIDIDNDEEAVNTLQAQFIANKTTGIVPETIQFTDQSAGDISVWSWDFGDGNTSSLQNPTHTYETSGEFTVALQVFNSVGGSDSEIKTNYISIRNARLLINSTDSLLINSSDKLLKN